MKIIENIDLSTLSYMKIGGTGKYLIEIEKEKELEKIIEIKHKEKLPILILGDGSNTVFNDGNHKKVFVRIKIDDIIKTYEDADGANITVGSGAKWDDLVAWTVKNKLSGLELLSAIPGSVGAAPIQNIGAYGSEVSQTITHVNVFDLETEEMYELSNTDCKFDYRDSVFKHNPGRIIVTSVSFRLSKKKPELPTYKDLALYFLKEKNKTPTLHQIRKAVVEVRSKKLPDPATNPNVGSFFKNPVVDTKRVEILQKKYPDIPAFQYSETEQKISGGWLIEKAGFKGKKFDHFQIDKKNSLIMTSTGKENGATFKELEKVRDTITKEVEKHFGIKLEVEPNFVY